MKPPHTASLTHQPLTHTTPTNTTTTNKQVAQLADLLEKMLALDPDKRISADSALRHDFIKPFLPKKKDKGHTH